MKKQSQSSGDEKSPKHNDAPVVPHCDSQLHHEYEEKKETRRLVHWMIKVLTLTTVFICVCVILTFCYAVLFHENGLRHELVQIFGSFINAVVEIIKFLFTNGHA